MASVASANFEPLISRNTVDEAIHDALHLFVGRGRRYTAKQLGKGAGVPYRMIESAKAPVGGTDFRPLDRAYLWSIMQFLGSAFTSELLAKIHQGAFDLPDEELPPPGEMVADSAGHTAQIAEAAADGQFCQRDKATLRVVGRAKIEQGMDLLALSAEPSRKAVAA
jgi:hypothetical protein